MTSNTTTTTTTTTTTSDDQIYNDDNLLIIHRSSSLTKQKSNLTISPPNQLGSLLNSIIKFEFLQNTSTTKHSPKQDNNKESNNSSSSSLNQVINAENIHYINQTHQLISLYGYEQFNRFRSDETLQPASPSFLSKHPISSYVRTKMVNWLLEVVEVMGCEPTTYFLTIFILDSFLNKTKTHYSNNDIHLLGITSLYIASKVEDIYPLRMCHIVSDIGKNAHDSEEVKALERKIIIELDFNLMPVMAYDFIMLSISDLEVNNVDGIEEYEVEQIIQALKRDCAYFLKVMALYEEFSAYVESFKGVVCIVMAFDTWQQRTDRKKGKEYEFLSQWVVNVIEESGFERKTIEKVYCKLCYLNHEINDKKKQEHGKYNVTLFYELNKEDKEE